jgi:DNA-binding XRE family transcriptional regulator
MSQKPLLRAETPEDKKEAERIKSILIYARRLMGYNQERAAQKIGINKMTYLRAENDFKSVNSYLQDRICDAFNLPKTRIFKE